MKVTIVGAGAVGASCAEYIAIKDFASEVVLVDIKENFAEGKAMDLMQTASLNGFDTKITGSTNDYSKTEGSNIAVIFILYSYVSIPFGYTKDIWLFFDLSRKTTSKNKRKPNF